MIYLFDFRSLYPSMMIGGNLYSPMTKGEQGWQGSGIYASIYQNERDGIRGKYSRSKGKIEKVIEELFRKRQEVKNDKNKSLAIKILINSQYGITGCKIFKSVYDLQRAADVTAMARRTTLHAKTVLEEYGYEIVYGDTDSLYVKDHHNNESKLFEIINWIESVQKSSMNIPFDLHSFKLEDRIQCMWFFRDDKGEFVKKKYVYLNTEGKVTLKGLNIKRGSCPLIAKHFFNEIILPKFESKTYKHYTADALLKELKAYTIGKETLLQKRYRVKSLDSYKVPDGKDEPNCIGYSISKKYGPGEHWLVINKRIGVGKDKKYATIEELKKKYGDAWIDQVSYEDYMNELKEFIEVSERNKIHRTDRRRINNGNSTEKD